MLIFAGKERKRWEEKLKKYNIPCRPTGVELGEGSFSVVIELKLDGHPSVRLAGKVFKIHGSAEDKLTKEIDVMVQLKHPNIVAYKGVYFQPDVTLPVLVMERLMTSLHTYLLHRVKSNLQLKRKIFILLDTARGLEYLHSLTPAIIHRHLTAKNVLLDSQLRAKIADFGNSRIMELHSGSSPMTNVPGTLSYMPPEAVGMSVKYGPNLDLFSFGHLSLFTVIQSPVQPLLPYTYTDSNGGLRTRSEVERRREFLERANELLLEGHPLLELIKQCLSNKPTHRPSAAELVARLHAVKSSSSEVKELQKKVLEACQCGKLDVIRMAGKRVDLKNCITNDEHGDTPLHYSAFHGQKRIVEYLLDEERFDVESKNKFENTPLHRAARQGHLRVVKYLVEEKKSDLMAACVWRRTPLHNACKTGQLEVVKYLMNDPRVDKSAKDSVQHQTPLQLAAEYGTVKVVQYMMENGVDREEPGPYTLLHLAAYGGKLDIVQHLIQRRKYNPMIRDKDEKTPLHSACVNGELKVVKYLLEECEVEISNCDNRYQESPLGSAAKCGQMKVVKYLVEERNCIIEHGLNNQNTALHSAAWGGALNVVKYFIDKRKCNPSWAGRKGRMPLHTACYNGKREVVDYLVDQHNVEVSCRDHDGATPLHLATKGGHLPLVKQLVRKHKCDHTSRDNAGKTPLDYASKANHDTTVTYLSLVRKITSGKLTNIILLTGHNIFFDLQINNVNSWKRS